MAERHYIRLGRKARGCYENWPLYAKMAGRGKEYAGMLHFDLMAIGMAYQGITTGGGWQRLQKEFKQIFICQSNRWSGRFRRQPKNEKVSSFAGFALWLQTGSPDGVYNAAMERPEGYIEENDECLTHKDGHAQPGTVIPALHSRGQKNPLLTKSRSALRQKAK